MSEILQDLSPASLVNAFEANLFSWVLVFGRLGQAYEDDPPGVRRSITDIPFGPFNTVMDARLAPEQVGAAVDRILSDAASRHVPVRWWIGPSTRPADLGKRLEEKGFVFVEESPGMAVDLANLSETLPAPEGLSIRLVEDDKSRRLWGRLAAEGFEAPAARFDFVANAWYDLLRHADAETTLAYVGWWNERPVATSLIALGGGVAGVHVVSTVPDARRQGIGAEVTLVPLLQARARGYRAGVLATSEMGAGVYRSLGFREYCKKYTYFWRPPA